ncbi:unnamed protein product [Aphis gossypii]|uniref:Uncharacterized protein n=1 Tax=Aphis gossypii TaxID=80765 RepID=A0A9P0NJ66_APHGO|nr:unnamed protein product [Aphis gossypii]
MVLRSEDPAETFPEGRRESTFLLSQCHRLVRVNYSSSCVTFLDRRQRLFFHGAHHRRYQLNIFHLGTETYNVISSRKAPASILAHLGTPPELSSTRNINLNFYFYRKLNVGIRKLFLQKIDLIPSKYEIMNSK